MVSLAQKLLKTCQKQLLNHIRVVLSTKRVHKTSNILKNLKRFPKSANLSIDPKDISLAKWSLGSTIKIVKNKQKTTPQPHKSCSV